VCLITAAGDGHTTDSSGNIFLPWRAILVCVSSLCPHHPSLFLASIVNQSLHRKEDTNWNTPTPLGSWYGVIVDENNSLLELNLEDNNLEGPQDLHLSADSLLSLSVSLSVSVSGTLPSSLTLCSKLKRLNLRGNKLTGESSNGSPRSDCSLSIGPLPDAIGRCTALKDCGLSRNILTGPSTPLPLGLTSCLLLDRNHS
jgi:hypothetical protein